MCKGQYRGVWRERKGGSSNSEMREKENRRFLDSYGSRDEDGSRKKLMIGLKGNQHFGSKRWPAFDCGKAFRLAHLERFASPTPAYATIWLHRH